MTCIFDRNVFDENVFDTCPPTSSSGSQDFQISYPFILKKMARGVVLRQWLSGTLLRQAQKMFYLNVNFKRKRQLNYLLNGTLLRDEKKQVFYLDGRRLNKNDALEIPIQGKLLRKKEFFINLDNKIILKNEVEVKEVLETLEILDDLDEI